MHFIFQEIAFQKVSMATINCLRYSEDNKLYSLCKLCHEFGVNQNSCIIILIIELAVSVCAVVCACAMNMKNVRMIAQHVSIYSTHVKKRACETDLFLDVKPLYLLETSFSLSSTSS